jgi:hypothetical protein
MNLYIISLVIEVCISIIAAFLLNYFLLPEIAIANDVIQKSLLLTLIPRMIISFVFYIFINLFYSHLLKYKMTPFFNCLNFIISFFMFVIIYSAMFNFKLFNPKFLLHPTYGIDIRMTILAVVIPIFVAIINSKLFFKKK